MKKILSFAFCIFFLSSSLNAKEKYIYLDELNDYNINQSKAEDGLKEYIGNYSGLSLSFLASDKEVFKVNFIFTNSDKEKFSDQIAYVMSKLMPKKMNDVNKLSTQILSKLNKLNKEGNDEKINLYGSRFHFELINGMINVQVVPYKYLNRF